MEDLIIIAAPNWWNTSMESSPHLFPLHRPGTTYKLGLGAVPIRDIQPFDAVAGVPAKPIKKISATDKEGYTGV